MKRDMQCKVHLQSDHARAQGCFEERRVPSDEEGPLKGGDPGRSCKT